MYRTTTELICLVETLSGIQAARIVSLVAVSAKNLTPLIIPKHIPCTSASEIDTCDLGASPTTRLSWNAQAANKSPRVNPCFCARASEANTTSKSKVVKHLNRKYL